jgi:hypothetical protein
MAKLTLINETMDITAGMTLIDKCPLMGLRKVTVARTTKTLIITTEGARYSRLGYLTVDEWRRPRLYLQA